MRKPIAVSILVVGEALGLIGLAKSAQAQTVAKEEDAKKNCQPDLTFPPYFFGAQVRITEENCTIYNYTDRLDGQRKLTIRYIPEDQTRVLEITLDSNDRVVFLQGTILIPAEKSLPHMLVYDFERKKKRNVRLYSETQKIVRQFKGQYDIDELVKKERAQKEKKLKEIEPELEKKEKVRQQLQRTLIPNPPETFLNGL